MPFDASTSRIDGTLPPEPPQGTPPTGGAAPTPLFNNALLNSIALRYIVAFVTLVGGGGVAGYTINDGSEQLDARVTALETKTTANETQFAAALKANQEAMQSLQDVAMLALELSVDGHRYLTDTMVDSVKLDHPDFVPRPRPERLERRLDRGTRILDDEMYAR